MNGILQTPSPLAGEGWGEGAELPTTVGTLHDIRPSGIASGYDELEEERVREQFCEAPEGAAW